MSIYNLKILRLTATHNLLVYVVTDAKGHNMSYVIYEKATTVTVGGSALRPNASRTYKTMAAALAVITRYANSRGYLETNPQHPKYRYAVADTAYFYSSIEQRVKRVNLMSGAEYTESVNTSFACSPASETYWSA